MIVALDWLRDFVDITESPQELADLLTMLGLEAESVNNGDVIKNVVTARITEVQKHPNADKLKLCQVYDGTETHTVVCGAPNTYAGQITAFARVGAVLAGGFEIKPAKIRGEKSFGMLCSERELGLSENQAGILDLDSSILPGRPISEIFPQPLPAIEFDITPNRPDCLSHYGVAREIALKTGRELKKPEIKIGDEVSNAASEYVAINITDPQACPRYIAGIVKNIKIGPSPKWMVERLEAVDQRSINNVVDISNYVLLELGQPTHIFDYRFVPTKEIVIRHAKPGEKIVTLDEVERKLSEHHLLITDGENPIAVAGIMGGERSGVADDTETVLIESAYFDPITVRKGSKSLGLITDSSRRFERGADQEEARTAFWRIVNLLEELAGGEQVPGMIDNYPRKISMPEIVLRKSELDLLAGYAISDSFVEETLTGLEIDWHSNNDGNWTCTAPTFRPDLEREVDYIEEIIRVNGYDNVPTIHSFTGFYSADRQDVYENINRIIRIMTGLGFRQCYSNSLQNSNMANTPDANAVSLVNPLSEEMAHPRTTLLPGLLQSIEFNVKNANPNLALYEYGQIFHQDKPGFAGIREEMRLTGILHGQLAIDDVYTKATEYSFSTVKGILTTLFAGLLLDINLEKPAKNSFFDVCYSIRRGKTVLGWYGHLSDDYIKSIGIEAENIHGFDLNLELLIEMVDNNLATLLYQPISVYPTIERDINFVLPNETESGKIVKAINQLGHSILKNVAPVDIFHHKSIGVDHKSITFRFLFQHSKRTLEEKEVSVVINEIIAVCERDFSAKLRT